MCLKKQNIENISFGYDEFKRRKEVISIEKECLKINYACFV